MKKIEVLIWVDDKAKNQSAQQYLAGGLPVLSGTVKPVTFVLDGTDKEILYKLLINTAATYFKAMSADDNEFMKRLADWKLMYSEFLKK